MRLARQTLCVALLGVLAACAPAQSPLQLGPDGQPVQRVYRIAPGDTEAVRTRALESINTLRAARGLAPLRQNAELIAAAERHSRDMAFQGRAWAFGSDGSSPLQRVARAGYRGEMRGQLVSETFESELETINAWMVNRDERVVLMDREAAEMGLAWYQEPNGKLWWTLVTGRPDAAGGPLGLGAAASGPMGLTAPERAAPVSASTAVGPPIRLVPGVFEEVRPSPAG
ncbi:MAG: divisome-associated lipoprotein DalA [Alkalilacustris sp.]